MRKKLYMIGTFTGSAVEIATIIEILFHAITPDLSLWQIFWGLALGLWSWFLWALEEERAARMITRKHRL